MANNISDKTNLTGHVNLTDGQLNWISQINAGGTTYDIATHHGITFKDGSNGSATVWNGLTDLEIIIPSITDIVKTPVEFAGTVGENGAISWATGHGTEAKVGNLLFITKDCDFGGEACEAGDMAIYDGTNWNVVSGENQVEIKGDMKNNVSTIAIGSAKDVLSVEGKTLALTLDYDEINNHISTKNDVTYATVEFDAMTVGSKYIKLESGGGKSETIGSEQTIKNAIKLNDGKVTFSTSENIATNVDFGVFSQGTLPEFTKNAKKDFIVTGGSVNKVTGSDFVDGAAFEKALAEDANKITVVDSITRVDGTNFVTGVHNTTDSETADFTIKGYMTTVKENVQFVEGIAGGLNPVTSISEGNFELVSGSELATGWGEEQNNSNGEVLSSVELNANNNTSVFNEAVVNNHVLSFGSTNVTSGASLSYKSKSLAKTGFRYTAPTATTSEFTRSGFKNVDDINFTFGKAAESTYTHSTSDWKIATTKGAYSFSDGGMIATVPAETFIASADKGTLPSWTGYGATHINLTGSVDTTLETENISFNALNSNTITVPGTYSLVESDTAEGAIEVGKSGDLANSLASVDLSSCITSVTIS